MNPMEDTASPSAYLDGEVMLAENNPKKKAGRKKFKETRHPVYRGVSRRNSGKWVCEVREPNTKNRVWLGTHPTAEMAARAHDVAVLAMRGRSACLNFADSPSRLPIPVSNDIKDIQKAAAEAAEAFRPREDAEEIEEGKESAESSIFVDEEEIYEMPDFLASMAEGLMISPPRIDDLTDDVECGDDGSLWSFH
ncbi:AP2/ERF domain-containing protein [Cynara cardunculus var. scolymus]|uniref:AP2/ERF domain-containing protein n=2 Tax=Cynara cardunculus var. scolymus TaxID=59895 RepID=A0A118JRQ3_CYNCS|nr:AP2/ERF domain-containing protein [Cynara cardunculus var. scolymus]